MSPGGHYAGATSQGEPISFDVTEDGSAVTNVVVLVRPAESGSPAVLSMTERFALDSRGGWFGEIWGWGVSGTIGGRVGAAGSGRGTLELQLDARRSSPTERLSTGAISWQACRVA